MVTLATVVGVRPLNAVARRFNPEKVVVMELPVTRGYWRYRTTLFLGLDRFLHWIILRVDWPPIALSFAPMGERLRVRPTPPETTHHPR